MMSGNGYDGWGWMWLVCGVVVVGIVVLVVLVIRIAVATTNAGPTAKTTTSTPEQILAERYARSELTTEQYRERVENLHVKLSSKG